MGPYVPLAEVQQRFSELSAKAKLPEPFPPRDARAGPRRALTSGPDSGKERRRKARQGSKDQASAPTSALALIAGWTTFGAQTGADSGWRSLHQKQQDAATHSRCMGQLQEMKHLETELDLTFRLACELSTPCWAQEPPSGGGGKQKGSDDLAANEVVLQIELQGNPFGTSRAISGRAQGLILRTHCSWGLRSLSGDAEPVSVPARDTASTTRPNTARSLAVPAPVANGAWLCHQETGKRPHTLGDSAHALRLDLRERTPETLLLHRVELVGKSNTEAQTAPEAHARAMAWIQEADEKCKQLEGSFDQKLNGHCEMLALQNQEAETMGSSQGAGALGYLSDIRAVLRVLGPGLPSATRLLEGAVKGLILSVDTELAAATQRIKRLEGRVENFAAMVEESDRLKQTIEVMKKDIEHFREKLVNADSKHEVENRALRDRIETLKVEIRRLTPDPGHLEGMSGLMADYSVLMHELEEECSRQSVILRDLTRHTQGIMRDANRLGAPTERGRIVALPNGEVLLRPHSVAEEGTQVVQADLLRPDLSAPIRLCRAPVRQVLMAFEEQDIPNITLEDLNLEIDKIYMAKIIADSEADVAGLPRSELANFIVEYYLDQLGSVGRAQQKLASIVECIVAAGRGSTPMPPKVSLFARFLEVCPYESALPLTVLNVVLEAKSLVQPKLETPLGMGRLPSTNQGRRARQDSFMARANSIKSVDYAEPQVNVAVAYQAAARAISSPGGGVAGQTELFQRLVRLAEVEGCDSKRGGNMREFYILMQLLHDCLANQSTPVLRELISHAEQKQTVTADEFQEAIRDAGILGIDDTVWKPKLCGGTGPTLSGELLLDYLGGGSLVRLPRAAISEMNFLEAVVDALAADHADRVRQLERQWERHLAASTGLVTYADFKTILQSAELYLPPPMLRTLFLTAVETSRSCSQLEGGSRAPRETLEPAASKLYGGEVVTFKLLALSALRCQLFLKDVQSCSAAVSPIPSLNMIDVMGITRRTAPFPSTPEVRKLPAGGSTPRRGSGGEGKTPRGGASPRRVRLA